MDTTRAGTMEAALRLCAQGKDLASWGASKVFFD
jgi:hypothetical protein